MQAAFALLIVGSTAWLAVDASKRDWTDNSFAKNVPTWVVGSLLLWFVIFPLYVLVHRGKAPLKAPPKQKRVPAVAMAASGPSEQYGPSLDDIEPDEVELDEPKPEPVVEIEPKPEPEPVEMATPIVEIEPEPDPVVELDAESLPEPEPVSESAAEPVLEISYPEPVDEAPPGLSVDAFKDIKPVAFGGIVVEDDEPAATEPAVPDPEPEPVVEVEPEPMPEPMPLSYPLDEEPVIAHEPEPSFAAAMADVEAAPEPEVAAATESEPEKRGFRIPNPELKLPSFGKSKRSVKLPQITLPPNLQGPLTDLERKIALGSVVAIVAAAAFGYSTAPSDEAASPTPTAAPAAVER